MSRLGLCVKVQASPPHSLPLSTPPLLCHSPPLPPPRGRLSVPIRKSHPPLFREKKSPLPPVMAGVRWPEMNEMADSEGGPMQKNTSPLHPAPYPPQHKEHISLHGLTVQRWTGGGRRGGGLLLENVPLQKRPSAPPSPPPPLAHNISPALQAMPRGRRPTRALGWRCSAAAASASEAAAPPPPGVGGPRPPSASPGQRETHPAAPAAPPARI